VHGMYKIHYLPGTSKLMCEQTTAARKLQGNLRHVASENAWTVRLTTSSKGHAGRLSIWYEAGELKAKFKKGEDVGWTEDFTMRKEVVSQEHPIPSAPRSPSGNQSKFEASKHNCDLTDAATTSRQDTPTTETQKQRLQRLEEERDAGLTLDLFKGCERVEPEPAVPRTSTARMEPESEASVTHGHDLQEAQTKTLVVESANRTKDCLRKVKVFMSENGLSTTSWQMDVYDKNNQHLREPPKDGVTEPFPITFVFTRREVHNLQQKPASSVGSNRR